LPFACAIGVVVVSGFGTVVVVAARAAGTRASATAATATSLR
jgi:hypothetical protein